MAGLLFGTGGTPHSARTQTTISGIECIAELGLGCTEIEFVQGVKMGEAGARLVAEAAAKQGIKLSAHAPYFINLNAHEPEKIRSSQGRLLQTARIAALCGAESIVFHPAFYLGDSPEKAYNTVKQSLEETLSQLKRENNRVWIRPETMGKASQFGTVEEILDLCTELEGLAPERLGKAALDNMHIHASGIAYGGKGELKHLNLKESDFQYIELLRALKDYDIKGLVICESPNLEEDALLLQATYNTLLKTD